MNDSNNTNSKKCDDTKSIRIKLDTKEKVDKKLSMINKSEEFGKVNYDKLIQFLIDSMTNEDVELLQNTTITWKIEEPRLMKLWSKKNGKVTSEKWKEMLYMGQLQTFIMEHTRISI